MPSIVDRVGDLGEYLREQREGARLSVRQLAALAGVSNPYLSQVERGLRHPSAEVLQQIAKGLRISAEALYIKAGILDSSDRPDVESAIAADPHLVDRQRRVLLDIYASFRSENARAEELLTRAAAAAEAVSGSTRRPATKGAARKAAGQKAGSTAKRAGTTAKKAGTTAKKAGATAKKAGATAKKAAVKAAASPAAARTSVARKAVARETAAASTTPNPTAPSSIDS